MFIFRVQKADGREALFMVYVWSGNAFEHPSSKPPTVTIATKIRVPMFIKRSIEVIVRLD